MPQSILVQVGQCGNQIGFNFWSSLLQEYKYHNNELSENDFCQFLKPKSNVILPSNSLEENYTARGILIDMEERVINVGLRSSIGGMFTRNQILTDVSGSGNNWAVGNLFYGNKYSQMIQELFRVQAEACDNLDSVLFLFSLGGGTGSGLGTYAMEKLGDYCPKATKIAFSVFPSDADDVITSPYNAALCNLKLLQHATLIVPFQNQVIDSILSKLESNKFIRLKLMSNPKIDSNLDQKAFQKLNELIVSTILNCTSSTRYQQFPNENFADLCMNLLPDEYCKYVLPSVAPLFPTDDYSAERLFNDVFSETNCLFDSSATKRVFYSCTMFCRGKMLTTNVVQRNLDKLRQINKFTRWNTNPLQYTECHISPVGSSASVSMLANSSSIAHRLHQMKIKLDKMYKKKAHLHHFTKEDSNINSSIDAAVEKLERVISSYQEWEATQYGGGYYLDSPFMI